ncbi:MAG: metallophosphoesterase [Anaerolineae bacterium]
MITVLGDIHGHFDKLVRLLLEGGWVDEEMTWSGGDARLWFLGDYFDRGPDGGAVVHLIMTLQAQAAAAGGHVGALLGNHELQLLAALQLGDAKTSEPGGTYYKVWKRNGGKQSDFDRLTLSQREWLLDLPAMAVDGDRLLLHADNFLYTEYGKDIETVNAAFHALLRSTDTQAWDAAIKGFSARNVFRDEEDGVANALRMLGTYGGEQIVHGHSPISKIINKRPPKVTEALVYCDQLCVNVDHGLYLGGHGFLTDLAPDPDRVIAV